MKIESLHMDGFGIFSGAGITPLAPGLTVICAANGGGKTTLRDFLRASLFGFASGKNTNRYERPNGAHGGTISIISGDGEGYLLAFDAGRKKQLLSRRDGAPATGLEQLLGSATRDLYENVFAIGLGELQDAKTLSGDQIHAMIGGFGSGRSGRSFQQVRTTFAREAEELFKVGGKVPVFNAALANHEANLGELKQRRANAEEYWTHEARLEGLRAKIVECQKQESVARQHCQHLENLEKAWPDWIEVQRLRQEFGDLSPKVESFPLDGTAVLEKLNAQQEQSERELRSVGEVQAKAQQQLRELVVCHELLAQSTELDELSEGCRLHDENLERQARLQVESVGLKQAFDAESVRLGSGMEEQLQAFDDGVVSMAEKAEAARQLADTQRAMEQCRVELARHHRRHAELGDEAEAARAAFDAKWPVAPPPQSEIDKRLKLIAAIRSESGKVELLRVQHAHIQQEAEEAGKRVTVIRERMAAAQGQAQTAPSGSARPLLVAGWAAFGAGLLVAALSYQNPVVAVVALLLGMGVWFACWRLSRGIPATASDTSGYLEQELKDWEDRAMEAGRKGEAAAGKLVDAETELGKLCQPFGGKPLDASQCDDLQAKLMETNERRRAWDGAQQQVSAAAAKVQASEKEGKALGHELGLAEETYKAARGRWVSWLHLRGLDPELSPEGAEAVCKQVLRVREASKKCDEVNAELQQLALQINVYVGKLAALLNAINRPWPETGAISRTLRELRDECKAAQQNLERQKALAEQIPTRTKEIAELGATRDALQLQYEELLKAAGAGDEDDFKLRAVAWEQRRSLLAAERSCVSRLEMLSAHGEAVQRLQEELSALDFESLAGAIGQAREELETLSGDTNLLNQELGQIVQARRALASEDKVLEMDQRCEAGQAELRDLSEAWAVRKLAYWLMEKARVKIEIERQPAVLKSASTCLNTMSGGKFTHILQPLGSQEYHIVQEDGRHRDNSQIWNTALREKAYLSLRFGLIDAYCAQAEALPLILDDALVNLDPVNYVGAVRCIDEMAQRHQIIYLTCHPHTLGHFSGLDTPPDFYEIRDGMFEKTPLSGNVQA